MKIWQCGAASNPNRVDGVSRTVWLLSQHLSQHGHDVSLVLDTPPDEVARDVAASAGLHFVHVQADAFSYRSEIRRLLEQEQPDLVHMHSVFVPRQAAMGRVLNQMGIPYIITPHAGLAPQVLRRGIIKKTLYAMLRERPRFMGAEAISLVTPAEERAVRAFIPDYRRIMRWMPNAVDVHQLDPHCWQGPSNQKRVVFLGRFDVLVKGIDVLVNTARLLPDVKFDLYGTEDPKTRDWLNELKRDLPPNVAFHDPIFGQDKARMLSGASIYFQPSRWEGFPVSVAECMYLGVPSAIADTLDIAQLFYKENLGLVVALDPGRASIQLRAAMEDAPRSQSWSERGRQFARKYFHPESVAQQHIELYEEVLRSRHRIPQRLPRQMRLAPSNGQSMRPAIVPVLLRQQLKSKISTIFDRSTPLFDEPNRGRTVVLCYHSINTHSSDLSVDPAVFRSQVEMLKGMGFRFLNFGDLVYRLLRWGIPRDNVACITLDDGYEDSLTRAAPILSDLHVPATVFVTTGLMAQQRDVIDGFHRLTHYDSTYLTAAQVKELDRTGIEIGAHSHTHANLARLNFDQTWDEVSKSKKMLEDVLGRRISCFAYPFGKKGLHYTSMTVRVVRESGFSGAAAVAFRSVNARQAIRIFQVPRFFITRSDTAATFRQKIKGNYDWLGAIQENTPSWLRGLVSPEERY